MSGLALLDTDCERTGCGFGRLRQCCLPGCRIWAVLISRMEAGCPLVPVCSAVCSGGLGVQGEGGGGGLARYIFSEEILAFKTMPKPSLRNDLLAAVQYRSHMQGLQVPKHQTPNTAFLGHVDMGPPFSPLASASPLPLPLPPPLPVSLRVYFPLRFVAFITHGTHPEPRGQKLGPKPGSRAAVGPF